jgi:hypothetical protein
MAPEVLGEIDFKQSLLQIFPAEKGDQVALYLYLRLRDSNGNYVDCDPASLRLQSKKGNQIGFTYERLRPGRYYLTIDRTEGIGSSEIDLFLGERPLKEQVKLRLSKPDLMRSNLTLISNSDNRLTLRLELRDQKGQPVELPEAPEILLDNQLRLDALEHLGGGVWRVVVLYPEDNQIMYFSVRAMGTLLPNLLRYQHIEK